MSSGDVVDFDSMGLTPDDFVGLAGAPFTQAEINAAVTTVRNAAFWHIAPELEETVILDVVCWEPTLRFPTRHLISVEEIRDADTNAAISTDKYRVSTDLGQARRKWGHWPHGYARVEADITHGYETPPGDLLPLIAEAAALARRDQSAKSYTAGPFSVGFGASAVAMESQLSTSNVLARYALWQPGIA